MYLSNENVTLHLIPAFAFEDLSLFPISCQLKVNLLVFFGTFGRTNISFKHIYNQIIIQLVKE